MFKAVKTCLIDNYFNFEGRASRSEFWWFALFCLLLVWIVPVIAAAITGGGLKVYSIGAAILMALLMSPYLGVYVRRVQDAGYSNWVAIGIFAAFVVANFLRCVEPVNGEIVVCRHAPVSSWIGQILLPLSIIAALYVLLRRSAPTDEDTEMEEEQ